MTSLVILAAAICLVYGSLAFVFIYSVEDEFFASLLEVEAEHIRREQLAGRDALPRLPFIRRYESWESVPAEVRARAASSGAREVSGEDGRHYHLRLAAFPEGNVWLVAEVGSLLIVRPMRSTLLKTFIPATALILLCSVVVAVLIARRTVGQLTTLVEAVECRSSSLPDDLSRGITDREVRVLADALEASFTRVQSLLEREKAFVGDVSHELRTPLAVIHGAAELLAAGELQPAGRAQLRRILEAARSSEEIIELMLALAREESVHEESAELPLLAFVEMLVLRHRHLVGRGDIDISVDISPQMRVLAPPAAAEVVISNLITNALRHGERSVQISGKEQTLLVRNGGTDGFRGGDGPRRPSAGIGLNLVRRLCEASGLGLSFESSMESTSASVRFLASRELQTRGHGGRPSFAR